MVMLYSKAALLNDVNVPVSLLQGHTRKKIKLIHFHNQWNMTIIWHLDKPIIYCNALPNKIT